MSKGSEDLILVSLIVIFSVIDAFVLTVLFGWFIFPYFNVIQINIPQTMGISLIIRFVTFRRLSVDESFGEEVMTIIFKPIFGLSIGYLISLFL